MVTKTNILQVRTYLAWNLWFWCALRLLYVYLILIYSISYRDKADTYIAMTYEVIWTFLIIPVFHIWYARRCVYILIAEIGWFIWVIAAAILLYRTLDDYLKLEDNERPCDDPGSYDLYWVIDQYFWIAIFLVAQIANIALSVSLL